MSHLFSHFSVNGVFTPGPEATLTLDEDTDVLAHYVEEGTLVSVTIVNPWGVQMTVKKVTHLEEDIVVPAGGEIILEYDPATHKIVLPDPGT